MDQYDKLEIERMINDRVETELHRKLAEFSDTNRALYDMISTSMMFPMKREEIVRDIMEHADVRGMLTVYIGNYVNSHAGTNEFKKQVVLDYFRNVSSLLRYNVCYNGSRPFELEELAQTLFMVLSTKTPSDSREQFLKMLADNIKLIGGK